MNKVCSCGEVHQAISIQQNPREGYDDGFIYFDCKCKSTLMVPKKLINLIFKEELETIIEEIRRNYE